MKEYRKIPVVLVIALALLTAGCTNTPNSSENFRALLEEAKNSSANLTPPEQLSVDSVNHCSVSLSWQSVDGAGGYNVYRSDTAGYGYEKAGKTTSTALQITEITAGQNNFFIVKSVTNSGSLSYASDELSVSVPVSKPGELIIFNEAEGRQEGVCITGAPCNFEWQNVDGCTDGPVKLSIYDSSGNLMTTINHESPNDGSEEFTLPCDAGLIADSIYTGRVSSADGTETAEYSFTARDWGLCSGLD